jgi:hypothetical protein
MADVIVEKESKDSSNAGVVVGIIAIVILVLAALFLLPGLMNNSGSTTTPTVTTPTVTTPTQQ